MDKKQLRSVGHHLKPVVTVAGGGLSENVLLEVNRALDDHELIKVKISIDDRDNRADTIAKLCEIQKAEIVQSIGKVVLLLRKSSQPDPKKSNLIRFLNTL